MIENVLYVVRDVREEESFLLIASAYMYVWKSRPQEWATYLRIHMHPRSLVAGSSSDFPEVVFLPSLSLRPRMHALDADTRVNLGRTIFGTEGNRWCQEGRSDRRREVIQCHDMLI